VITGRGPNWVKHALFDLDWNRLNVREPGMIDDPLPLPRPPEFDLVLEETRLLSEDFLHVRVDFLKFGGRLTVSELTFANAGARAPFEPRQFNVELGARMDLSLAPERLERGRRIAAALGWAPDAAEPQVAQSLGWTGALTRATQHLWPTGQTTQRSPKMR